MRILVFRRTTLYKSEYNNNYSHYDRFVNIVCRNADVNKKNETLASFVIPRQSDDD